MAKNGKINDGHRDGAVKQRSQVFNPKNENGLNEILKQVNSWTKNLTTNLLREFEKKNNF